MNRVVNISFQEPFKILCVFNNGEQRILDIEQVLDTEQEYAKKVFDQKVFNKAKVGAFGEIFWEGIAEMKDLNGSVIPCQYDICPDFAYLKSKPISKKPKTKHLKKTIKQ